MQSACRMRYAKIYSSSATCPSLTQNTVRQRVLNRLTFVRVQRLIAFQSVRSARYFEIKNASRSASPTASPGQNAGRIARIRSHAAASHSVFDSDCGAPISIGSTSNCLSCIAHLLLAASRPMPSVFPSDSKYQLSPIELPFLYNKKPKRNLFRERRGRSPTI